MTAEVLAARERPSLGPLSGAPGSGTRLLIRAPAPAGLLAGDEPPLCLPVGDAALRAEHHRIRHVVFVEEQGVFASSDVDDHDQRDDVVHVLALHRGRPAGTVRLYPVGPGEWLGDRLAVLPECRSASVGAPLVRCAVATAGTRGARLLRAHVQVANERFFRRLGWDAAGPVETYVGRPHVPMTIVPPPVCPWLTGPVPAAA